MERAERKAFDLCLPSPNFLGAPDPPVPPAEPPPPLGRGTSAANPETDMRCAFCVSASEGFTSSTRRVARRRVSPRTCFVDAPRHDTGFTPVVGGSVTPVCRFHSDVIALRSRSPIVGDRVVALPELGAWAELVAVPAKYAFPIPAKVSFADAVAITLNYTVAYILLFELAGLTPGKNLLVHSVAGGVGQAIAQLSKTVKDVHVFGVASKDKHEAIQSSVNTLIERGADYSAEVKKISEGGVDFVLDCLCGEDVSKGYNLLKPLGKYILYGSANSVTGETKSLFTAARSVSCICRTWWQVEKFTPTKLFEDNKSVSGFNLRHLLHQQNGSAYIAGIVEKVFALFKDGKIKPIVDSTWALEDVPEAMQKLHDRKNVGKVILDPSLEPKPKPATPAKSKGKDKEEKKKEDKEKNKDKDKDKDKEKEKEKEKEKDKDADKNGSSNPPAEDIDVDVPADPTPQKNQKRMQVERNKPFTVLVNHNMRPEAFKIKNP
ncbi:unnamed protein product [Bemisia tabaci]|uniref:Enoyl reductase (ER) domain-containing protein n=1 Tax=Bemisia tabaci TaxID=7038 RepID=A0A9P0F530_BEMTA|nr:unnamed protein product [Bemisia tabaci]